MKTGLHFYKFSFLKSEYCIVDFMLDFSTYFSGSSRHITKENTFTKPFFPAGDKTIGWTDT